tara:strand:- start:1837 stop:2508 length:672 start_codon:yes stop_codon:yes gene_type:complete
MKILNNEEIFSIIKGKKVAVIGNSPSLKNSNKGDFIDTHDVVIRFNEGPLYYEDDTNSFGKKCSVWATNGWSAEQERTLSTDKHEKLIKEKNPYILGTRPIRNDNNQHLTKGLQMRGPIFDLLKSLDVKYIDTPQEIFNLPILEGNFNLSSGAAVIMLLLHFEPENLSLLGFNFFDHNKPTHFWDNKKFMYTKDMKENNIGHNGDFEKQLITSLAESFNININ